MLSALDAAAGSGKGAQEAQAAASSLDSLLKTLDTKVQADIAQTFSPDILPD
jgi:hypothetical protein